MTMIVYECLWLFDDKVRSINSWNMWPMAAWHALDVFAWPWPSSPSLRWRPSWRRVRPTRLADGWWPSPRWAWPVEVQQKLFFERPKKLQNCHKCWQWCHFDLSISLKVQVVLGTLGHPVALRILQTSLNMISSISIKSLKPRSDSVFARQDSDVEIKTFEDGCCKVAAQVASYHLRLCGQLGCLFWHGGLPEEVFIAITRWFRKF